jgi:flagellar basal body rod protein FlgC
MRSAMLRLETSARNVARAGATQATSATTADGGPVYLVTRVNPSDLPRPVPAVSGVSTRSSSPAWMAVQQDGTGEAGAVRAEVNLAQEAFEQATARASFIANAKTLHVTQEMVKRLFEID